MFVKRLATSKEMLFEFRLAQHTSQVHQSVGLYYKDENGNPVWADHNRENEPAAATEVWKKEQEDWNAFRGRDEKYRPYMNEHGLYKNPIFVDLLGFFCSYLEDFSRPTSEDELEDMARKGAEFVLRKDPTLHKRLFKGYPVDQEKNWDEFLKMIAEAIAGALQVQPASEGDVELPPSTEIPEGITEQLPDVEGQSDSRFPSVNWN